MNPPGTTARTATTVRALVGLHRPLVLTALLCAAALLVTVPGVFLDGRTVG